MTYANCQLCAIGAEHKHEMHGDQKKIVTRKRMAWDISFAKFCPICGEAKPKLLSRRASQSKNLRYRCEGCQTEFTVHQETT